MKNSTSEKYSICDLVFSRFLIEASKIINKEMYAMIALIFRALRVMLNLYGYVLMTQFKQQNEKISVNFTGDPKNSIFSETESPEFVCIMFDFFLKRFLPAYLNYNNYNLWFVSQFLMYFSKWLMKNRFSSIRIAFNSIN